MEDSEKQKGDFTITKLLRHAESAGLIIGAAGTLFALYLSFVFDTDASGNNEAIGLLILSQYIFPILIVSFILLNTFNFIRFVKSILAGIYRSAAFLPIYLHRKQYFMAALGTSSGLLLSISLATILTIAMQFSYLAYKEQKYFLNERVRQTIIIEANDQIKLGQLTSAARYFQRAQSLFPDDGRNIFLSDSIEEIKNRERRAGEFLQAAKKLLSAGDAASAFIYADISSDLFPEVFGANEVLLDLYEEIEESRAHYKEILAACENADYGAAFRIWNDFKLRLFNGVRLPSGPEQGEWLCSVEPSPALQSLILERVR